MAEPMYASGAPLAEISIDGRVRHLRLTLLEMRRIEERLSQIKGVEVQILDVLSPGRRWSMTELITMLTVMLAHEDPDLTEDYLAEHVDLTNLAEVTQAIGRAMNPAMPEPKAGTNGDAPDPPSAGSTGSTGGPLPASILALPPTSSGA